MPTMHRLAFPMLWLCAAGLPACAGAAVRDEGVVVSRARFLSEERALALVGEVLDEEGVAAERGWRIRVGGAPLEVDLRLAGSRFGIEWVSPADRQAHGQQLPDPDPNGQLRIVTGEGPDARDQVLVLDFRSYRFHNDPRAVERGAPDADTVEARLRRDVRDFLVYVRGQQR